MMKLGLDPADPWGDCTMWSFAVAGVLAHRFGDWEHDYRSPMISSFDELIEDDERAAEVSDMVDDLTGHEALCEVMIILDRWYNMIKAAGRDY